MLLETTSSARLTTSNDTFINLQKRSSVSEIKHTTDFRLKI